jgi:hypothetical protein
MPLYTRVLTESTGSRIPPENFQVHVLGNSLSTPTKYDVTPKLIQLPHHQVL